MQTFLPYADFRQTARCLDYRRLGKQRIEAYQILNTLLGLSTGWSHHPATLMWKGYEPCLKWYGLIICQEWMLRGYVNRIKLPHLGKPIINPPWLGDERLHSSHRSNLLRKFPEHYNKFNWVEPNNLPYYWPAVRA